ncbi:V-type ATP synthase subunit D [Marispirochaeta aestuarii]|uniref:V-type ATP synthase subunit D n=1 Tax=Marispirochaeta aestuarii TaxID=1963862 RepID=A0A1Y1S1G9_9SPIO|nr:V-type ATP synthase subunit D [Marispirochaeta aestuarii]ORC37352.1 V-type ATP synthase subunit D [Marispirochaeta aestuarii]
MAAVKLTKNELKKQKDSLKRFQRYLPTLQLKKQQLQLVIRQVEAEEQELRRKQQALRDRLQHWIAVFGDEIDLEEYVQIDHVETETGNIAGVDVPVFKELDFKDIEWDLLKTPLWIDKGIAALKELITFDAEVAVLQRRRKLLHDELRTTSQRVNLFEKVKIPESKENIRRIQIYLGDQQTAAVVRGKMAKAKVVGAS